MPTSIRLDADIERRLDFLASSTGRSKAYYLREIIEQGIADMEEYYLAAEGLGRLRKGRGPVHSAAGPWAAAHAAVWLARPPATGRPTRLTNPAARAAFPASDSARLPR